MISNDINIYTYFRKILIHDHIKNIVLNIERFSKESLYKHFVKNHKSPFSIVASFSMHEQKLERFFF